MNSRNCQLRAGLLALFACIASVAGGQDRESLKNPVHRINNGAVAGAAEMAVNIAPPVQLAVVELSPVPTSNHPINSLAAPRAAATVLPVAERVDKVASLAAVTSVEPTPRDILGHAVSDSQLILTHIKTNIKDYTCTFLKRERIDGVLSPVERIELKVRNRVVENGSTVVPFSVYMKFRGPKECRNREILFVEGANNGKILAKEGGTRGRWLPSVWLRPDGSFAMKSSRYPISQVGMQRLTERLIESAQCNDSPHLCKIKYITGAKVGSRSCSYLEVIRDKRKPGPIGPNNIYLVQIFFDEKMQIPVRYAAYDWPEDAGGKPQILEEYTYQNVKLNVGLSNRDFDKNNPNYNF